MLPVVAIYSTFFQRAYDQLIHDVSLMKANVLFAVDRAGLVPNDGETHQGIYDTAFFSQIGIPTYSPCNYEELEYWLEYLVDHGKGPRALRYPRGDQHPALAKIGCSGHLYDFIARTPGAKVALVSYGAESEEILAARELLAARGIAADCCKLVQIHPLPANLTLDLSRYSLLLFAEEGIDTGGIGQQLGFALQQLGWQGRYRLHAVNNQRLLHATVADLRKNLGLDAAALAEDILNCKGVSAP